MTKKLNMTGNKDSENINSIKFASKCRKMLFILNPRAGTMQASRFLADILRIFGEGGYVTTVMLTTKSGDGKTFVMKHGQGMDLISCAGGDGTLNEVIDGVLSAGLKCAIGYIPAGSTNDFASSLDIPKSIIEAAQNIIEGEPRSIDVGSFNGRYFSYVASFGVFTSTSYNVPQSLKNMLGHTAYILQGARDLLNIKPIHTKIIANEGMECEALYEGEYIFGAVCNSRSVGGMVKIKSDNVDMNDGRMELVLIEAPKRIIELQQIGLAVLDGSMKSEYIKIISIQNARVKIEDGTHWTLDGEYEEGGKAINIDILKSAMKIILP